VRAETEAWWTQAEADLLTADVNLEEGRHYAAVFFCQNSVKCAARGSADWMVCAENGTARPLSSPLLAMTEVRRGLVAVLARRCAQHGQAWRIRAQKNYVGKIDLRKTG
jgi:hypothetical protein